MNVSAIIVTRGDVDLDPVLVSLPVGWEVIVWDNGAGVVTLHQVDFGHLPIPPEGETITVTKMTDPGHLGRFAAVVPLGGQLDLSVYGRYAAIQYTSHDLVYVQDDDVIVSDPQAIVDALWNAPCQACGGVGRAYPGSNIACPACLTWGTAYAAGEVCANMPPEFRHDGYTDSCLVGFGACFHRDAPRRAFDRWQAAYRPDASQGVRQWTDEPSFNRTADVIFTTLTPRVLVDVPRTNLPWAEDDGRMYRQKGHVEERARMLELARQVRDA